MVESEITVLLVDDHAVVRQGYRRLLESEAGIRVVGEAGSAKQAYELFCRLGPKLVIVDLNLPGVSGLEAMRRMRARSHEAIILAFSMHEEELYVRRALEAGASGYVTKASAPNVLVEAVRTVARRRKYLSPDVAQALVEARTASSERPKEQLSPRQMEILRLLLDGRNLPYIAENLGLSEKTVANHQSEIRRKFGASSAVQLIRAAIRSGLGMSWSINSGTSPSALGETV